MALKICEHGELLKLKGGGYYFLCRFDEWEESEKWRKGSQCRYARWCPEERKYCASTDEGGNMCPHFSLLRPKISEPIKLAKKVEVQIEKKKDESKIEEESTVSVFKSIFSDSDVEEKDDEEKEEEKKEEKKERPSRQKSK